MRQSPLKSLQLFGQSPWLDTIERRLRDFDDYGQPEERPTRDMDEVAVSLTQVEEVGIDLAKLTDTLLELGIEKFERAFNELHATRAEAGA